MADIGSFLRDCSQGGGALLVVGDAGVGKSAVLDAAAIVGVASGFRVLRGAGVEFEADFSFAGLHQLLLPIVDDFSRLPAVQREALSVALGIMDGPPASRLVLGNAVLALLQVLADSAPVLLMVDDLPWIDRSSALVLSFVAHRLSGTAAAFLGAMRTGDESFFERANLPIVDVSPLNDGDAAQLLAHRFPQLAASVGQRVIAEARGIPLALLELPRELSSSQLAAHDQLPALLPLTRRLQTVFQARVRLLPNESRRLLLHAALDASGDLGVFHDSGADALATAERARLVTVDLSTRRLTFQHPLIRSAVVGSSTGRDIRAAHRALAVLPDIDPAARAHHLIESTVEPDEKVAAVLEETAYLVLRRGDAVGAVSILVRAAGLSPNGAGRARRLAESAWIGADVTGALRDVSGLLRQAREADPGRATLPSAIAASYLLINGEGDVATAHRLLVGALDITTPEDSMRRHLDEGLRSLILVGIFGNSDELWTPIDRLLKRFADELSPIVALSAVTDGDPARSTPQMLSELAALVAALHGETDPIQVLRTSIAALYVDQIAGCRDALLRVVEDGRHGGAVASGTVALLLLCQEDFKTGHWDQAAGFAAEAANISDSNGYHLYYHFAQWITAMIAAATGDAARCQTFSANALQWSTPRRMFNMHTCVSRVNGLAALSAGDFELAYREYAAITTPGTFAPHQPYALLTIMELVEAALRSGRHDAARSHVAAALAAGIDKISPRLLLLCTGAGAMVASDEVAAELFERALSESNSHRWAFDRARVELAYGEWLRRQRAMTAARVHLIASLDVFERLGAHPWSDRARAELQATARTRRSADPSKVNDLTPQELEIAKLAASGLTNRQIGQRLILSPRTVGAHLYSVFPKLGVASRAGLRDALNALDL